MSGYGKVTCSECGKVVSGRVPAGGDGSALFPWRHRAGGKFGQICTGTYTECQEDKDADDRARGFLSSRRGI